MYSQELLRIRCGAENLPDEDFFVDGRINPRLPGFILGIVVERLLQCAYDSDIIDYQPVALSGSHPVRSRNGLHQSMGLQRLIQVQAGKSLHIEAGQPHCADKHNSEVTIRVLILLVQFPLFHLRPVRQDIQSPFLKRLDLVLLLADHHAHLGFLHPLELPGELHLHLVGCG